jgi:prefoldin alpha subunit
MIMTNDEEISRCMMIVEQCKQQMSQLEMQAQYIEAAIMDYNKAKITLEKLSEIESETDMIIPIGGGIFIDATAKKESKPLVDVGSGIVVEKNYEDAIKKIDERIEQIEKSQARLEEMMQQIQAEAAEADEKAQKLMSEKQG